MRERSKGGGGGGKVAPETVKQTCPYLGLAHDQFSHLPEPSSEHRCYLYMQRERIDQSHQQRFCLTPSYPSCPWLMVSPAAGVVPPRRPWQRFIEAVREQFDELERMTMRNRWPRALLALLLFILEAVGKGCIEGWRAARPILQTILIRLWVLLQVLWHRLWLLIKGLATRPPGPKPASVPPPVPAADSPASPLSTPSSTASPPEVTVASSATSLPVSEAVPTSSALPNDAPEQPVLVPDGAATTPRAPLVTGLKWECANCYTFNLPSVTFCQRCGRLSSSIEAELLAKEDFFTLDGLKALMAGDEEGAHRYFVLSTQANPHSELAWRWRARTSLTVDDVITCLEQMLAANPASDEARRDLELARMRKDREIMLEEARAAAVEKPAEPSRPSLPARVLTVARRLALELASVPSFVLGLLWAGPLLLAALATAGVSGFATLVPVFRFPVVTVSLPATLVEPVLPATFAVADVLPYALAVWYLLLAFRVADGSNGARYAAIASGLLSLGATHYLNANGQIFVVASVALLVLSLVGKGLSSEEIRVARLMPAGLR